MRISSIALGSRANNLKVDGIGSNLAVIFGPNEAGKTTLRRFVNQTLFGTGNWKPSYVDGSLGLDLAGIQYLIERDRKGRRILQVGTNEPVSSNTSTVISVLSGSNPQLLDQLGQLCTLGLNELALLKTATPAEVEYLLAGLLESGNSSGSLKRLEDRLKKEFEEIYKPRASCALSDAAGLYRDLDARSRRVEEGYRRSQALTVEVAELTQSTELRNRRIVQLRRLDLPFDKAVESSEELLRRLSEIPTHLFDLPLLHHDSIKLIAGLGQRLTAASETLESCSAELNKAESEIALTRFGESEREAFGLLGTALALEVDVVAKEISELERESRKHEEAISERVVELGIPFPPFRQSSVDEQETSLHIIQLDRRAIELDGFIDQTEADLRRLNIGKRSSLTEGEARSFEQELTILRTYAETSKALETARDRLSRVDLGTRVGAGQDSLALFIVVILSATALAVSAVGKSYISALLDLLVASLVVFMLLRKRYTARSPHLSQNAAGEQVEVVLRDFKRCEEAHEASKGSVIGYFSGSLPGDVQLEQRVVNLGRRLSDHELAVRAELEASEESANLMRMLEDLRIELELIHGESDEAIRSLFGVPYLPLKNGALGTFYKALANLADRVERKNSLDLNLQERLAVYKALVDERKEICESVCALLAITPQPDRIDGQLSDLRAELAAAERNFNLYSMRIPELNAALSSQRILWEETRESLCEALRRFGIDDSNESVDRVVAQFGSDSGALLETRQALGTLQDSLGSLVSNLGGEFEDDDEASSLLHVAEELSSSFAATTGLRIASCREIATYVSSLVSSLGLRARRLLESLEEEVKSETEKIVLKRKEITELEGGDLFSIADDIGDAGENIKYLLSRATKLKAGITLLGAAKRIYSKEQQPVVLRAASEFFSRATAGRYIEILVSEESKFKVVDLRGRELNIEDLSSGTVDLLMISLRISYLSIPESIQSTWPVIFDDVMVNIDSERRGQVAKAILEASRSRQILYLTCHGDHRDQLAQGAAEFLHLDPEFGFSQFSLDRIEL